MRIKGSLPRLADGTPFHGSLGEIAYDADENKVQCHLCGRWMRQINGKHLTYAHGWTMAEYRQAFKLPKRVRASVPELTERRQRQTRERVAPGGDLAVNAGRFKRDREAAVVAQRAGLASRVEGGPRRTFYSLRPVLREEWDAEKNQGLSPETLGPSSTLVVWWKGICGHEWQASITSRALSGTRCPQCVAAANRRRLHQVAQARIDQRAPARGLAAARPDLAAELHPSKNPGVIPERLLLGSGRRVWWRCPHGHDYQARVANRVRGTGCPYCSRLKTLPERSIAVLRPDLLADWHPTRNSDLDPHTVPPGSLKTIWWQCAACGHEWQTQARARATPRHCCPQCRPVKP